MIFLKIYTEFSLNFMIYCIDAMNMYANFEVLHKKHTEYWLYEQKILLYCNKYKFYLRINKIICTILWIYAYLYQTSMKSWELLLPWKLLRQEYKFHSLNSYCKMTVKNNGRNTFKWIRPKHIQTGKISIFLIAKLNK